MCRFFTFLEYNSIDIDIYIKILARFVVQYCTKGLWMTKKDPKKLILEVLRKHPEGLTIVSIARMTGLHRHTSTKYIHELIGADMIRQRHVGAAKLCYLSKKVSKRKDEENMLKELEKRRSGGKHKLRIILAVVLLSILLSETAILATQNISLFNETNLSEISSFNTSPMTATAISNVSPKMSEIINQTFIENSTSDPNETSSINEPFEKSNSENVTDIMNNSDSLNKSVFVYETVEEPVVPEPTQEPLVIDTFDKFLIELFYPDKITRGDVIAVRATATNIDSSPVRNVILEWILPDGFGTDDKIVENCGELEPSDVCNSEITIKTDFSTVLGLREIKIVVNYEE